jgi:hypothetical protein
VPIDTRKWFDRTQPQTLQIATWLLYLNALFRLIDVIDAWRSPFVDTVDLFNPGRDGLLFFFLGVPINVLAGLYMANDRKLGYKLAIAGALWPFLVRLYYSGFDAGAIFDDGLINLVFDIALVALVLHPQSRSHQRVWFK